MVIGFIGAGLFSGWLFYLFFLVAQVLTRFKLVKQKDAQRVIPSPESVGEYVNQPLDLDNLAYGIKETP